MKILFLDMDGVMNSHQSAIWYHEMFNHNEDWWADYRDNYNDQIFLIYEKQLCPLACSNLRNLLKKHPDVRIVISSTWRKFKAKENNDWFNALFQMFKIYPENENRVIGCTPVLNKDRGYEIESWLNQTDYEVEDFIILDDDSDMGPYLNTKHFIHVDGRVGFDYIKMQKADKIFGNFCLTIDDIKPNHYYLMYGKPRDTVYFLNDEGKWTYEGNEHNGFVYVPVNESFSLVGKF